MPSGLILFNKKSGITSFGALGEIKRSLGTSKVGHTGTLDKFAQGLMIILAGKALKLSRWFSHLDKQYLGKIHFGIETDTLDPEGNETARARLPSRQEVEQALLSFTGDIMQKPPAYSAIHINGKRASDLARSGKAPEMKKRPVTIYKLCLRSWQPPYAEIFVHCSSGTYIRSLARDIACAADSRAHLCALTRTQVAGFMLQDAQSGQQETHSGKNPAQGAFYTPLPITREVINSLSLPWIDIESEQAEKIIQGKPLDQILNGLPLSFTPISSVFSAVVFCGENIAAVVEKNGENWKYECVF